MDHQTIEALDQEIKAARVHIDLSNALERLQQNPEFKQIVVKGYFEQEAVRLVHAKADPAAQSADTQAAIVRDMDAIGSFHQYLRGILRNGDMARAHVESAEEMREGLLSEAD